MLNIVLFVIHIVSSVIFILFFIYCIWEYMVEAAEVEKMLKRIHCPLSNDQIAVVGFICMALMFITANLREKLF